MPSKVLPPHQVLSLRTLSSSLNLTTVCNYVHQFHVSCHHQNVNMKGARMTPVLFIFLSPVPLAGAVHGKHEYKRFGERDGKSTASELRQPPSEPSCHLEPLAPARHFIHVAETGSPDEEMRNCPLTSTAAKKWRPLRCPWADGRTDTKWSTHTMK